ncbi:hypothetical protein LEP1GSC048_0931 [Leptospira santarosai serovar Shermani str. 1342KT]|nr:hypothetical protein LEP1GSC048_0931 [Leptospira santarosai serovar Shermani str. 1342KT]
MPSLLRKLLGMYPSLFFLSSLRLLLSSLLLLSSFTPF